MKNVIRLRSLLLGVLVCFIGLSTDAFAQVADGKQAAAAKAAPIVSDLEPSASVIVNEVPCEDGFAGRYTCENIDMVAFLPKAVLGVDLFTNMNDIWGWTDPDTGKEYVLAAREDGTSFIDISDPVNPIVLGDLPMTAGTTPRVWRDLKVYSNHVYIVADNAGAHGIQIFDLTQLRNIDPADTPITFQETAIYTGVEKSHNIVINEETGFGYAVGSETCGGGFHIIDLSDPVNPSFVNCYLDSAAGRGYSHDAQCVVYRGPDIEHQGKEICLGLNEQAVLIADVTNKTNPSTISIGRYSNPSYVHQGWLTDDHRYLVQNDELDELNGIVSQTRTLIWDLEDLDDPILLAEYFGPSNAIDHNLYIKGKYAYMTNYTSGLRILDISDPAQPEEVGFFDTFTVDDRQAFEGTWSNYPFFESGIIAVNSIREGVFLLRLGSELVVNPDIVSNEEEDLPNTFKLSSVYPNPFNPAATVNLTMVRAEEVTVTVYNALGHEVARLHEGALQTGTHQFTFEAAGLPSGTYLIRAKGASFNLSRQATLLK